MRQVDRVPIILERVDIKAGWKFHLQMRSDCKIFCQVRTDIPMSKYGEIINFTEFDNAIWLHFMDDWIANHDGEK